MLVANSFDLWQKDTFFSAAEEVQQSADIMESAYRTWARMKSGGLAAEDLDELCRELQTALGTAKWQLDEFERAVSLSYRNRADDTTAARHRQFVDAIQDQIFRVEAALRDSFIADGKQPLRWVNLDEEERDDLAAFLSGSAVTSPNKMKEYTKLGAPRNGSIQEDLCVKKDGYCSTSSSGNSNIPYPKEHPKVILASNKGDQYIIDIEAKELPGTGNEINSIADGTSGTQRMWSSPNIGSWKIGIADEDDERKDLIQSIEVTPKDKGAKPVFSRQRCRDHPESNGGVFSYSQFRGTNCFNQILLRIGGRHRQLQAPLNFQLTSVRFKFALMLIVFFMVPFVLYST